MKTGRRWISGAMLWAWLAMLAVADWRSSLVVLAAFIAIVVWERARARKAWRVRGKAIADGKPAGLPTPRMTPVRDA